MCNLGKLISIIVLLLGVVLVAIGVSLGILRAEDGSVVYAASLVQTILISVGTSMIATALVTMLTNRYLMQTNKAKRIIDDWGLVDIYETKGDMNVEANQYLSKAKGQIDIIAIGMSGYINNQGDVLKQKLQDGLTLRIISCNPKTDILLQREKDETNDGTGTVIGQMSTSISELNKWIDSVIEEQPTAKIEIRYHSTYPSFSYLRIDDKCFFGANLFFKQSQHNMAFEFSKNHRGYSYYNDYFNKLWNSNIVKKSYDVM